MMYLCFLRIKGGDDLFEGAFDIADSSRLISRATMLLTHIYLTCHGSHLRGMNVPTITHKLSALGVAKFQGETSGLSIHTEAEIPGGSSRNSSTASVGWKRGIIIQKMWWVEW